MKGYKVSDALDTKLSLLRTPTDALVDGPVHLELVDDRSSGERRLVIIRASGRGHEGDFFWDEAVKGDLRRGCEVAAEMGCSVVDALEAENLQRCALMVVSLYPSEQRAVRCHSTDIEASCPSYADIYRACV